MNLQMQGATGTPQNLPAADQVIATGPMGDCVSVIVLFGYDTATRSYTHLRGWHGLGGAQVIDMAAMLAGVPNVALTQIIVIPGSLQQSGTARAQTLHHITSAFLPGNSMTVRYVAGLSHATVDRHGAVT